MIFQLTSGREAKVPQGQPGGLGRGPGSFVHTADSTAQGLRLERPGAYSKESRAGEINIAAQSLFLQQAIRLVQTQGHSALMAPCSLTKDLEDEEEKKRL